MSSSPSPCIEAQGMGSRRARLGVFAGPVPPMRTGGVRAAQASNDGTVRDVIWHRFAGDEWAAFDQLPPPVRRRLSAHAYDAWSVNALILWRRYRRLHPTRERAERALSRYLDHCERLERRAFADQYRARYGLPLPHDAAAASVLRPETKALADDITTSRPDRIHSSFGRHTFRYATEVKAGLPAPIT